MPRGKTIEYNRGQDNLPLGIATMSELLDNLQSVSSFLSAALGAIDESGVLEEDSHIRKAIAKIAPWCKQEVIAAAGKAASQSLPLIGFVLTVGQELAKEKDPNKQGYRACTLAYCRAVEQAFQSQIRQAQPPSRRLTRTALKAVPVDVDMEGFTWDGALDHDFVRAADDCLEAFAGRVGFEGHEIDRLRRVTHREFKYNLRDVLVHPDTADKFAAFTAQLQFEDPDRQDEGAIARHCRYQTWLYEEARVFRLEPFALAHIYIDTDCSNLTWGQIKRKQSPSSGGRDVEGYRRQSVDPFSESNPRQNLLEAVLDYFQDPKFNEPIIIQGPAGSGKSSFTLRLADELTDTGFTPIRVLLKHLDVGLSLSESIPKALRFSDRDFKPEEYDPTLSEDWLDRLLVSNETQRFQGSNTSMCPYVFIFDGWDELSIGASQSFKKDIDDLLTEIRKTLIDRGNRPPIRVIVTGRPSADVTDTKMLRPRTPILTVQPLTLVQLKEYIERLLWGRKWQPFAVVADEQMVLPGTDKEIYWFEPVLKSYEGAFESRARGEDTDRLEVLGLPILTYLAMRLLFRLPSPDKLDEVLNNSSTLYRALVDMTYKNAGKASQAVDETDRFEFRVKGWDLRKLLWKTAWAITATGSESISRKELKVRLQIKKDKEFSQLVERNTADNVLTCLIISYFFKEGSAEQGCEFLHKSFREYLFAEGIIEILKDYGREVKPDLPERSPLWQDFSKRDRRFQFIRSLAKALAPNWRSEEIKQHLLNLLRWEITRARQSEEKLWPGTRTEAITVEQWERVRDGLADLWDWWAEGVLLRPQPEPNDYGTPEFMEPFVVELACLATSRDPDAWKDEPLPEPTPISVVDARLGEALFHLAAIAHAELMRPVVRPDYIQWTYGRRYQNIAASGGSESVLFTPGGDNRYRFARLCDRICASDVQGPEIFPAKIFAARADLMGADLEGTCLRGAYLEGAYLVRVDLGSADLEGTYLRAAYLEGAYLEGANLEGAYLEGADLRRTNLGEISLRGADLRGADLEGADLGGADLGGAYLGGACLEGACLRIANLYRADLGEADLGEADLVGACLEEAYLREANLAGANLEGADLRGANLKGTKLQRARYSSNTVFPEGFDPDAQGMVRD